MTLLGYHLGWSRNFALGVIWHTDGKWVLLLLGLALCRVPDAPPAPYRHGPTPCGARRAMGFVAFSCGRRTGHVGPHRCQEHGQNLEWHSEDA